MPEGQYPPAKGKFEPRLLRKQDPLKLCVSDLILAYGRSTNQGHQNKPVNIPKPVKSLSLCKSLGAFKDIINVL